MPSPQATAGTCSHSRCGHRQAISPPTATNTMNAKWTRTVASARSRYSTGTDRSHPMARRRRPLGHRTTVTSTTPGRVAWPRASGFSPHLSSYRRDEGELRPLCVDRERVAEHRGGEPALRRDREPFEGNVSARRLDPPRQVVDGLETGPL